MFLKDLIKSEELICGNFNEDVEVRGITDKLDNVEKDFVFVAGDGQRHLFGPD